MDDDSAIESGSWGVGGSGNNPAINFSVWSLMRMAEDEDWFVFEKARFEFVGHFPVGVFDEGYLKGRLFAPRP